MSVEPGTLIQQIFIDDLGVERVDDITDLWERMQAKIAKDEEIIRDLREELTQVKARRGFEETRIVHDPSTGMAAVVTTIYRMEAKTMRLEFDPLHYSPPTAGMFPSETRILD